MAGTIDWTKTKPLSQAVVFRPGTVSDSFAAFGVFEHSLADLVRRVDPKETTSAADPAELARMWQRRRSLYEHLARTADQFWLAERDGQAIAFARSIVRDNVQELTELFVLPDAQSAGLGRSLMDRALPKREGSARVIISSPDLRAQALYLKSGVYPRFPIYYFWRRPEPVATAHDLRVEPVSASPAVLAAIGEIDMAILEHRRDVDHNWLLADRQGYLYYRDGQPVGYGYVGDSSGPFALLDERDFPAVLAHAETQVAARSKKEIGLEVPSSNHSAVAYLLGRGYQITSFIALFMSDVPFGRFENYIITSPPFFF